MTNFRSMVPALATLALLQHAPELPQSRPPDATQRQAQVMGSLCQTPFGVCLLVDPNGTPYQAPVGSPCFCGPDAGTVIIQ